MKKITLTVLLTLTVCHAKSQFNLPSYVVPNTDWFHFFSSRGNVANGPTAIDANNNMFLTGYTGSSSSACNILTQKRDSTGALVFTAIYNNGNYDKGNAIKIHGANVHVAGVSYATATNNDYVIIKYSGTGSQLWAYRYDFAGQDDEATDIKVDAAGNSYVTGTARNSNGDLDIVTIKLDAGGVLQWSHVYNGSGNLDDVATGLVIISGDIFVAGYTTDATNGTDVILYQLNGGSGTAGWQNQLNGTANLNDKPNGITISGEDVLVCGEVDNTTTGLDAFLMRVKGSNGVTVYQQDYDFGNNTNRATALVRDSIGNVGVVGTALNGSVYEYHATFYDSTGVLYSVNKETTNLSVSIVDPRIACDTIAHHFYVCGEKMNLSKDIFVYQLTPSGNTSWRKSYDGHNNSDIDAAIGLAVNGVGVVYVAGLARSASGQYDYASIRINQTPVYIPVNYNFQSDTFSYSNLFYPNLGEIRTTAFNAATKVKYYTKFTYPNQYLIDSNRVAFCEYRQGMIGSTISDTLSRVDMELVGSNPLSEPYPINEQQSSSINYFTAGTGTNGITGVKGFSHLLYANVYPNIDFHYTSNGAGSKFYFVLKPGANPDNLLIKFSGAESTSLQSGNTLKVSTVLGSWEFDNPQVYNVVYNFTTNSISTQTITNAAGWTSVGNNSYRINLGNYNNAWPLIVQVSQASAAFISDTLNCRWSTYVGGGNWDSYHEMRSDGNGNTFITGFTQSNNFPLVPNTNVFQNYYGGSKEGFIDKYDSQGQRIWSTFIGDINNDEATGIDFAANGDIYVVGTTESTLATTPKAGASNSLSPLGGTDIFVLQLSFDASQKSWLTYYGGNNKELRVKCKFDSNGNLFLAGQTNSHNLPIISSGTSYTNTINDSPSSGATEGFIVKYNSAGQIVWATYMGSSVSGTNTSSHDGLLNLDIASNNHLYVVGYANGHDYPNVPNGNSTNYSHVVDNSHDATISHFSNSGQLIWSTFMGGDDPDAFLDVRVKNNKVYAVGYKTHSGFPLKNSGNWYYSSTQVGLSEGVLVIFNNNDSLLHSTYFCGVTNSEHITTGIDIDDQNMVYVAGLSSSSVFSSPLNQQANVYINQYKGSKDNFIYALAPGDTNIVWATNIGGTYIDDAGGLLSFDSNNNLHLLSTTFSGSLFPLYHGTLGITYFDGTYNGVGDVSITRFNLYPVNFSGLNELKTSIANLRVYPNPTQSIINVRLNTKTDKTFYYIYNTMGQLVKKGIFESDNQSINISELVAGIYVMELVANGRKESVKLIKNE